MSSNIPPYKTWFESLRSLYLDIIRYIDLLLLFLGGKNE